MKKFSERLRFLMEERHIKAADCARATTLNKGYISMLLSGKKENPSAEVVHALASYFGCDGDWLSGGTGDPKLQKEFSSKLAKEPEYRVAAIMEEGPEGAAQHMTNEALIESLESTIVELPTRAPIIQKGYLVSIRAMLTELRNRLKP